MLASGSKGCCRDGDSGNAGSCEAEQALETVDNASGLTTTKQSKHSSLREQMTGPVTAWRTCALHGLAISQGFVQALAGDGTGDTWLGRDLSEGMSTVHYQPAGLNTRGWRLLETADYSRQGSSGQLGCQSPKSSSSLCTFAFQLRKLSGAFAGLTTDR